MSPPTDDERLILIPIPSPLEWQEPRLECHGYPAEHDLCEGLGSSGDSTGGAPETPGAL